MKYLNFTGQAITVTYPYLTLKFYVCKAMHSTESPLSNYNLSYVISKLNFNNYTCYCSYL